MAGWHCPGPAELAAECSVPQVNTEPLRNRRTGSGTGPAAIALTGFNVALVESLTSGDVVLLLVVSTLSAVEAPELLLG